MSGGGGGGQPPAQTVQKTSPPDYAIPYYEQAAKAAQSLYTGAGPSYFPRSTTVPMSAATTQGLGSIENLATQGGVLTPAARNELLGTIQGRGVNPFLGQAVQAATAPIYDTFKQETIPQLQSIFARTGGTGGSAEGFGAERAATALGRGLAEKSGELAYRSAEQERQNQLNALNLAPTLDAARFADAQALLGVGAAREGQSQAELQSEIDKYNYEQNLPALRLNQYIAQLGGAAPGGTVMTNTYAKKGSPIMGALGGAAMGASAGSVFGPWGAGVGGALGGLGGLGSAQGWF